MLFDRGTNRSSRTRSISRFAVELASPAVICLAGTLIGFQPAHGVSAGGDDAGLPTTGSFWEFPSDAEQESTNQPPALIALPTPNEPTLADAQPELEDSSEEYFVARLLPPQPLPPVPLEIEIPQPAEPKAMLPQPQSTACRSIVVRSIRPQVMPVLDELTEQERLLAGLLSDSSSAATGVLTDSRVNELAKSKIQHAYAMASRGSLYVARQELVEVLRLISQAKDAQRGTSQRSSALAAGIRALREAEDFAPAGTQLEAELDIDTLCASHRTPIAEQADAENVLPSLMMNRYLRYSQLQLAISVAGEPAGSMALHALGKLDRQLGQAEPEKHRLADRRAIAYQQAALLAHNQNHLAAHELGVLLASSGHYAEAQELLSQVASREPNAVVFRNLARVQEKLGQQALALANRDHARQLSRQGATGTNNVQWVSPQQFAQTKVQAPRYSTARTATAQMPANNQVPLPGSRQPLPSNLRR